MSEPAPLVRCGGSGGHAFMENFAHGGSGCCPDCCGMDFPDGPLGDNSAVYE